MTAFLVAMNKSTGHSPFLRLGVHVHSFTDNEKAPPTANTGCDSQIHFRALQKELFKEQEQPVGQKSVEIQC